MSNRSHTGHAGSGGIQKHSCGKIMPWTIVLKGCGFDSQHVYALNGTTGEMLSKWHYSDTTIGQHSRSFSEAIRLATQEASDRLALVKAA